MEFRYFCHVNTFDIINASEEINQAIPIAETFNPFFWILMGFNLLCIAFIRTINPGYLRVLFDTALNNRHLLNNIRDDLNLRRASSILLNLTYFNCIAAIISFPGHNFPQYIILIFSGVFFISALIKLFAMQLISITANARNGIMEHTLNHLIFFQVAGVILTPLIIFTHYVSEDYANIVFLALSGLAVLFILVREFQSIIRAIQSKVSIFYIILYLCTLELLPLIVGIRVLILNNEVLN